MVLDDIILLLNVFNWRYRYIRIKYKQINNNFLLEININPTQKDGGTVKNGHDMGNIIIILIEREIKVLTVNYNTELLLSSFLNK